MRKMSEDEKKLWDHVKKTITPLGETVSTTSASEILTNLLVLANYTQPSKQTPKKQSKSEKEYQAVIDLHGMTQNEAYELLAKKLNIYKLQGHTCILVITGKGGYKKRQNTGVLRRKVPQWFEGPKFKSIVKSSKQAGYKDGGEGALYVYLNRDCIPKQ